MKMLESFTKRDKESIMTIYYQLENMLVAGFKSEEELQRYQGLKAEYEEETLDYSFSIREIVNQLEIIIQSRENDFPNLEEGLLHSFLSIAFEKIAFCNFCSCLPNFSEIYCNFFLRAFVVPNPYKCKGIYRNMI